MNHDDVKWRKSTFSGSQGDCVEVAEIDDAVAVRNSNHPERGVITFPVSALAAFVRASKAGELDDMV